MTKKKAPYIVRTGNHAGEIDLEEKRFYIPGVEIKATCPECGKPVSMDLSEEYLGYPDTSGAPFEHTISCGAHGEDGSYCEGEAVVRLTLTVTADLKVVERKAKR